MRRGVGATLKRKDGRLRPVEYRLVPLLDGSRTIGTLMTFSDISERVRLDLMLQDMQETAKVGAWDYLPDNDRLIWTDEVYRIHDMTVGCSLDLRRIEQCYDEADRKVYKKLWEESLATGRPFEAEMRMVTGKGRALWVHLIGNAERVDGRTRRMHGIIQDITARRMAEQKLRETRDFFAQTLDAMPTIVNLDARSLRRYRQLGITRLADWLFRVELHLCARDMSDPVLAAMLTHDPLDRIIDLEALVQPHSPAACFHPHLVDLGMR